MKKLSLYLVILFGCTFQSCRTKCDKTYYFISDVPIYESIASVRKSFNILPKQEIIDIKRIVENETAYFLLEGNTGVHVVQKIAPNAVQLTAFISLSSCLDISVSNTNLYVAQGVDIIQIDVSDFNNIRKVNTQLNVINLNTIKQDSIVIRYEEQEVVRVVEDGYCDGEFSSIAEIAPDEFNVTKTGPYCMQSTVKHYPRLA